VRFRLCELCGARAPGTQWAHATASRITGVVYESREWGWVASGSLSRTSPGRMLASGSCYFRAHTLTPQNLKYFPRFWEACLR